MSYNHLPEMIGRMEAELDRAVQETAEWGVGEMRLSMGQDKSGLLYGKHRASAPGESPAIDTGNLVNDLNSRKTGHMAAEIVTNVEYAGALEWGRADGRMAPRPFFRPQADPILEQLKRRATDVLRRIYGG